jgi:hypothetical protein
VRFIAEALGADVSWAAATETAVIVLDSKTLRITVGQMAQGIEYPLENITAALWVNIQREAEKLREKMDAANAGSVKSEE